MSATFAPSRDSSRSTAAHVGAVIAAGVTVILAVVAIATGMRHVSGAAPQGSTLRVEMGGRTIELGRDLVLGSTEGAKLDLALAWPGLAAARRVARGPDGKATEVDDRGTILVSIRPADDSPDPSVRPTLVHGRFLEPDTIDEAGDLVSRRFKAGSPYEGERLVFSPPDGRTFAARCPAEAAADQRCVALLRRRGLDLVVSLDPALVGEGPSIKDALFALLERAVR